MVRAWARRGRRHRPGGARAGPAAGPLSHQHRRRPASGASTTGATARRRGCCSTCPRRTGSRPHLTGYDAHLLLGRSRLSLYGEAGRERLLRRARSRPRARAAASPSTPISAPAAGPTRRRRKAAYRAALRRADIVWPPPRTSTCCSATAASPSCRPQTRASRWCSSSPSRRCASFTAAAEQTVAAEPVAGVVDTTAAGDSFAAAYLAARLAGAEPAAAARCGHRLAGAVVCHRGAIIPRAAMPDGCRVPVRAGEQPMTAAHSGTAADAAARSSRTSCAPSPDHSRASPSSAPRTPCRWRARWLPAASRRWRSPCARRLRRPRPRPSRKAVPEAIVGIGTVLTPQDLADRARPAARASS